jgi:hypothetical protein
MSRDVVFNRDRLELLEAMGENCEVCGAPLVNPPMDWWAPCCGDRVGEDIYASVVRFTGLCRVPRTRPGEPSKDGGITTENQIRIDQT